MKRKLLNPEVKQQVLEEQRRIISTIQSLTEQLVCVDCGGTEQVNYFREGVKICSKCYSRNWQREHRAKLRNQAG